MAINLLIEDTEGFNWDFQSDRTILVDGVETDVFSLVNGEIDAFDNAFVLSVNGVAVNPQNASVDEGGREINTAPVLVGGVAVSRSILISDAAISPSGFARFLDSFTNTTEETITITVQTRHDSGADGALQVTATSDGNLALTVDDTGFAIDDANTTGGDTAVMLAYGDGTLLPASISQIDVGVLATTHTLTLAPGETQSLLQFATQNNTDAESRNDLTLFADPDVLSLNPGLLTGLSDEERLSVVNYAGAANGLSANTLVDSDGNRWGIDGLGRLSTLDSIALQNFRIPIFDNNWNETVSVTADSDSVTVVTGGFDVDPTSTVTFAYNALEEQGLIRLLITWVAATGVGDSVLAPVLLSGDSAIQEVVQAASPQFGVTSGIVLDDSVSGSSGTLPAITYVFGATGADNTTLLNGPAFSSDSPGQGLGAGETQTYLYYFALNDSGLAALADLTRLNTPGFRELAGLSAAEVALLQNFDLDESDRLQQRTGDATDDDFAGNAWGDRIEGLAGNDDISGGGSDDALFGGDGNDVVAGDEGDDFVVGGRGADLLLGGAGDDDVLGGFDNDRLHGNGGDDFVDGQGGDDQVFGGSGDDILQGDIGNDSLTGGAGADLLGGGDGNDTLIGGSGDDTLLGNADNDTLFGNDGVDNLDGGLGDDTLTGGNDADALLGDLGNDTLFGGDGDDEMDGEGGNDRLEGGTGADTMFGGEGDDTLVGGEGADSLGGAAGVDTLLGGLGDDRLFGGDGDDSLTGSAGLDTLTGGAGNDSLFGGADADTLIGGLGEDVIEGGAEADRLTGGAGADRFVFTDFTEFRPENGVGRDTIVDFSQGADNIDLSAIDPIPGPGNAFSFVGVGPITALGQVRFKIVDGNTIIQTSLDASTAFTVIELRGEVTVQASDFIL